MKANAPQMPDFRKVAEEAFNGLPQEAAQKAMEFFLQSFNKEGFTDASFIPWPKRKDAAGHKILSQSLILRGSLRIARADMKRVHIAAGENIPYAAIHNNGGTINVKVTEKMRRFFWYMFKKTDDDTWKWMALTKKEMLSIRIPKRQFIGESYTLNKELDQMFIKRIIEAQKKLKF